MKKSYKNPDDMTKLEKVFFLFLLLDLILFPIAVAALIGLIIFGF